MSAGAKHRSKLKAAWWAEEAFIAPLDLGLAGTLADFDAAFTLLHDQYVGRGYMPRGPSGRRLSLHNILPSTKVIVAKAAARVVGTLTVVEDSRLGLPMDEAFGMEIGRLRQRRRRVVEAGSLALDPSSRAESPTVLIRLFRMATLYAAMIVRADDLCFVVHPRHRAFYQTLFPFQQFPKNRVYQRIKGVPPTVGFRLDLRLVRALVRTERSGLSAGPFTHFLFGPGTCKEVILRLRRDLPGSSLTPAEWAGLFTDAAGSGRHGTHPSPFEVGEAIATVQSTAAPECRHDARTGSRERQQ